MIDLEELRQAIKAINTRKRLFRVLKEELSLLGYWKNRQRGNPKKGYNEMLLRKDR